jgi:hypothetical protein
MILWLGRVAVKKYQAAVRMLAAMIKGTTGRRIGFQEFEMLLLPIGEIAKIRYNSSRYGL